ncbi:hypothetical protein FDUTEX481_08890 [Tolypothrix sp. PCC 7601]|nr:hypothetical protein FDUTEX481_08890 [Tolypothrix sp. PCC 7601]
MGLHLRNNEPTLVISVDLKVLRSLKNGSLRYSFGGKYTKADCLAK